MKIAIIGAGAAGCFAAANIPYHSGVEVAVYEKTGKVLQKVKYPAVAGAMLPMSVLIYRS